MANNKVKLSKTTEKALIKTTVFPPQSNQAWGQTGHGRGQPEQKDTLASALVDVNISRIFVRAVLHMEKKKKKKIALLYFVFKDAHGNVISRCLNSE